MNEEASKKSSRLTPKLGAVNFKEIFNSKKRKKKSRKSQITLILN